MKFAPYSFSKLNCHEQCNRRFKYQYVDKIKQEDCNRTALVKGGAVHSILEHYPNPSNHKRASAYQALVNVFAESKLGQKYLTHESVREIKFGMTGELEECGYFIKECMFRGSVDFVALIDGVLHLNDWKTGKLKEQRYQNYDQLTFYAVYFFKKYPNINKIRISYVYVEHDTENDIMLERKYLENYIDCLMEPIQRTEADKQYKKCPSRLCDWCPYQMHCELDVDR